MGDSLQAAAKDDAAHSTNISVVMILYPQFTDCRRQLSLSLLSIFCIIIYIYTRFSGSFLLYINTTYREHGYFLSLYTFSLQHCF